MCSWSLSGQVLPFGGGFSICKTTQYMCCVLNHFSDVWLCAVLWTVAFLASLSMGFSRQEYGNGLPWPPPGNLPDPGIKPASLMSLLWLLHCQAGSLLLVPPGKSRCIPDTIIYVLQRGNKAENMVGESVLKRPHQFSSVAQSCPTLYNPKNCSTPGFPVHHQLQEFTQTHVHWVSDAIQPSHPLSSPSSPTFNLSQHQGLFQWVSSLHQVAKILEFQLQH